MWVRKPSTNRGGAPTVAFVWSRRTTNREESFLKTFWHGMNEMVRGHQTKNSLNFYDVHQKYMKGRVGQGEQSSVVIFLSIFK